LGEARAVDIIKNCESAVIFVVMDGFSKALNKKVRL
jgi:hypothetical protein